MLGIAVVVGDDLGAEQLDHLDHLVVLEALVRDAEDELVATDLLVLGDLLVDLVGRAAQQVARLDQRVERRLVGDRERRVRPHDGVLLGRHRVVVHVDHRVEVATAGRHGDLAGPLAVRQADHGVGHHDVVVHELAERLGAVGDALLVGVDAPLEVVDGLEVERDCADALLAGGRERAGVATADPQRRVARTVRLGQDVVGLLDLEELPVERVVLLLPHAQDLGSGLVPHLLGLRGEEVEGGHLVAAGTAARAPLVAIAGDVVEHGDSLGVAHRMVDRPGQVHDPGADVDLLGLGGDVREDGLGGRHVGVLGEGVVLAEPRVLPVELVGVDGVAHLPHDHLVLRRRVVSGGSGKVPVEEETELHEMHPCCGGPERRATFLERVLM